MSGSRRCCLPVCRLLFWLHSFPPSIACVLTHTRGSPVRGEGRGGCTEKGEKSGLAAPGVPSLRCPRGPRWAPRGGPGSRSALSRRGGLQSQPCALLPSAGGSRCARHLLPPPFRKAHGTCSQGRSCGRASGRQDPGTLWGAQEGLCRGAGVGKARRPAGTGPERGRCGPAGGPWGRHDTRRAGPAVGELGRAGAGPGTSGRGQGLGLMRKKGAGEVSVCTCSPSLCSRPGPSRRR